MNKRLLLSLYDRSGLGAYMPVDLKGHELEVEEHMEKFAELIVRECVEICKKQEYKYWRSSEEDQWTPIDSANAIQEHFGVEEE